MWIAVAVVGVITRVSGLFELFGSFVVNVGQCELAIGALLQHLGTSRYWLIGDGVLENHPPTGLGSQCVPPFSIPGRQEDDGVEQTLDWEKGVGHQKHAVEQWVADFALQVPH